MDNNEVDEHRIIFGQVEPTPEPAPDNPEEADGDVEETENEDPT